MYKDPVGDLSAADTTSQSLYDTFWEKAKQFLEEDIETAVDDHRHSQVVHLAKAVSVCDLREQVTERCPQDTPIPSEEYFFVMKLCYHHSRVIVESCMLSTALLYCTYVVWCQYV